MENAWAHQITCLKTYILFVLLVGDPILPGVERQSENSSLHLHPGENERSHHRDQLQTVCAAGGRRGTDLSTQQHPGGGECNLNPTSSLFVRPAMIHIQWNQIVFHRSRVQKYGTRKNSYNRNCAVLESANKGLSKKYYRYIISVIINSIN